MSENDGEETPLRRTHSERSDHEEFFRRLSEISTRRNSEQVIQREYDYFRNEPGFLIFSQNEAVQNLSSSGDEIVPLMSSDHSNSNERFLATQYFGKLDIPDSVLIYALEFLSAKNVARLCRVNTHFAKFAGSRM
jgi:hypothetical protein